MGVTSHYWCGTSALGASWWWCVVSGVWGWLSDSWVLLVGAVASVLVISMVVPQMWKVFRDRVAVGVALGAWGMYVALSSLWFVFGVRYDSPAQVWVNVVALPLGVVLLVLLGRTQHKMGLVWLWLVGCAVGASVVGVAPVVVSQVVMLVVALCAEIPQVVVSFRSWREGRQSEVSVLTWVLGALAVGLFGVYGWGLGLPVVVASSVVALMLRCSIVVLELSGRSKLRRDGAPVGEVQVVSGV